MTRRKQHTSEESENVAIEETTETTEQQSGGEKEEETPLEKFERIAAARTSKAIAAINLIGEIPKRGDAYEYTEEHVNRVFSAIEDAIQTARNNYQNKGIIRKFSF